MKKFRSFVNDRIADLSSIDRTLVDVRRDMDEADDIERDQAIIRTAFEQVDETNRVIARVLEAKGVAAVRWDAEGNPLEIAIPLGPEFPGKDACRILFRQKIEVPGGRVVRNEDAGA